MILIETVDEEPKRQFYFSLIDAHHHIGDDEDGHRNLITKNSFDFYSRIWSLLYQKYNEIDSLPSYFSPKFHIKQIEPPWNLKFIDPVKKYQNTWIFDQAIVFPFHDKQRNDDKSGPTYKFSNNRIAKYVSDSSSLCRLIGYCRIDLNDGEIILNEIDRSINTLGLKGIKLHPLSDKWNNSDYFLQNPDLIYKVFQRAISYNVPIIFDCRYESTLQWIYDSVEHYRQELIQKKYPVEQIDNRFKVIIAHISFWQNNPNVYEILSHPNIYADLTGLFGQKTKDLFENLISTSQNSTSSNQDIKSYSWWKKLVMGTDFDYFDNFHIVDQLLYFLSTDFYTLIQGNLSILENLFSKNILRLLPYSITTIANMFLSQPEESIDSASNCIGVVILELQLEEFFTAICNYYQTKYNQKFPSYVKIDKIFDYFDNNQNNFDFIQENFQESLDNLENQNYFVLEWAQESYILIGIKQKETDTILLLFTEKKNLIANSDTFEFRVNKLFRGENVLLEFPSILTEIEAFFKKH